MTESLNLLTDIITKTQKAGADNADAIMGKSVDISVGYRMRNQENLERSESNALGLRVIVGKRQAVVSTTDTSPKAIAEMVERGVAMAKIAPEDPYLTLAEKGQFAESTPELDLFGGAEPSLEWLQDTAKQAEEVMLSVEGVTNSGGAGSNYASSHLCVATSKGFAQEYKASNCSISACALAGEGTKMERDYDYTIARYVQNLDSPEKIGKAAAEKALRRLNPRKVKTGAVPVIFDRELSKSLVSTLASAINGAAIARGTSFLKDRMGQAVFNEHVTIVDDPHRKRGMASKPFDAEGIVGKKRNIIENGSLTTWIMDLRSAKQLGLQTTGHAGRSIAGTPSPSSTNLYMENGTLSLPELMGDIKSGLYVTDTFGMGINTVTGDYSQGAAGFWIENGEIAYPVNEITIAGNLADMFKNLTPANDLQFKYGTNAPTIRIESMMVAGAQ